MKFKFNDSVKIIGGFYEGLNGIVDDYSRKGLHEKYSSYYVRGNTQALMIIKEFGGWIKEKYLEKI